MRTRIKKYSWAATAVTAMLLFSLTMFGQRVEQKKSGSIRQTSAVAKAMTLEEKLVRLTYRKLEVYNMVSVHRDGRSFNEIVPGEDSIKFEITNFRTGKIDDIKRELYTSLVQQPTEEIIRLTHQTITWDDGEAQVGYRAQWRSGQHAAIFDRNWTIGDILKFEVEKYYDVVRYGSYTVTASLGNKTRSYSAIVLFHGPVEKFRLEFWDVVTGMGGTVSGVWNEQRLPVGLKRKDTGLDLSNSSENFRNKIRAYLDKKSSSTPRSDRPLSCNADSENEFGCCLDPGLASFWEVDPCEDWQQEKTLGLQGDADEESMPEDIQFYSQDDTGHISGTGVHHGRARFRPSCTELPDNRQRCNVEIRDQGYGDTESNHSDSYYHVGTSAERSRGNEGPRGQAIDCEAAIGFAFDSCFFSSCNVQMTLNVSGQGMGASATVSGGNLWRTARAQGNVCNLPSTTSGSPGGCNESAEYGCLPGFTNVGGYCTRSAAFMSQCARFGDYDPSSCACTGGCNIDSCSPIVVDVLGNGFNMTSASTGVFFDMAGEGSPQRFSWTSENSDDAWLALDRNNNGLIDSGRELFGNVTAQDIHPEGVERNGFLALALYDSVAYGGNGDGVISNLDSIFNRLRLWRDDNHNGVSEACELFALPDLGLEKIDLDYRSSRRVDQHGNEFRYRSKVRASSDSNMARWAWDIFLVRQP